MCPIPLPEEDFREAERQPVATLQLRVVVEGQQVRVSYKLGMLTASEMGWGSQKYPVFSLYLSKQLVRAAFPG